MLSLLALLVMAVVATVFIAKAGFLTFAGVALSIFMILRMTGCSKPPKHPYCETKAVHKARIHLDYEDPDIQQNFNKDGLPIPDPKANMKAHVDPGKLSHVEGL